MGRYITAWLAGILCLLQAEGQHRAGTITPPEQELARILLSDTVSHTVSYLQAGYAFGLPADKDHSLVIVKNGPRNYVLRNGTHEVYLLTIRDDRPSLIRLDSTKYSGDNFHMMAFARKDTLYQYGGYGFWNTRDFFMRFRPSVGDWEFLNGGSGLPNELSYHFYDTVTDAFYVVGSLATSHHPYQSNILLDTVYRFDFPKHRWTSLGRISDEFKEFDHRWKGPMSFCMTPFGMLDCRSSAIKLFDIPGNRVLSTGNRIADSIIAIGKLDKLFSPDYHQFVYLNGFMYILHGNSDYVRVTTLKLHASDFNQTLSPMIYVPTETASDAFIALWPYWAALLFLLVGGISWQLRPKRPRPKWTLQKNSPSPDATTDQTQPSISGNVQSKTSFFRSQLSASEQELLDMLIAHSLSGKPTDIKAINKLLGVSDKTYTVQKTRRSLTMSHINEVFRQVFSEATSDLIVRDKDPNDKRLFLYRIDERYLQALAQP